MPKWHPKGVSPDTRTAINTEWGCYCSSLLPRCKEDLELDAASGPQQGWNWLLCALATACFTCCLASFSKSRTGKVSGVVRVQD
jgi:hypothetical protein